MDLVIKTHKHEKFGALNCWQVGWRINCKNGEKHDMMWGAVEMQEEKLQTLLQDIKNKDGHKFNEIIDERNLSDPKLPNSN